jgi:hypothetical protein
VVACFWFLDDGVPALGAPLRQLEGVGVCWEVKCSLVVVDSGDGSGGGGGGVVKGGGVGVK